MKALPTAKSDQLKGQISKGHRLHLPHDTLCGAGGGDSGWTCLTVFLDLRLQPFPLLFLRLLVEDPATGGLISENISNRSVRFDLKWINIKSTLLLSPSPPKQLLHFYFC